MYTFSLPTFNGWPVTLYGQHAIYYVGDFDAYNFLVWLKRRPNSVDPPHKIQQFSHLLNNGVQLWCAAYLYI